MAPFSDLLNKFKQILQTGFRIPGDTLDEGRPLEAPVRGFITQPKTLTRPSCIIGQTMRRFASRTPAALRPPRFLRPVLALAAQVIHFESNGMAYQVLTREGLTLMCAAMPFQDEPVCG